MATPIASTFLDRLGESWTQLWQAPRLGLRSPLVSVAFFAALLLEAISQFVPVPTIASELHVNRSPLANLIVQSAMIQMSLAPYLDVAKYATAILPWSPTSWRSIIALVAAAVVWTVAGAIICLSAGSLYWKDRLPTAREYQVRFVQRWTDLFVPILVPLAVCLSLAICLLVLLVPMQLPWIGAYWSALGSLPAFGVGLALAATSLTLLIAWPLMPPAVMLQRGDGFDALSRCYNYVLSNAWRFAGYAAICLAINSISMWVAFWGLEIATISAVWCSSLVLSVESITRLHGWLRFWLSIAMNTLAMTWFWTLATFLYLQLRQDEDGVPVSEITDEPGPLEGQRFPVVGIPAADRNHIPDGYPTAT